jgi:hypothetical protein
MTGAAASSELSTNVIRPLLFKFVSILKPSKSYSVAHANTLKSWILVIIQTYYVDKGRPMSKDSVELLFREVKNVVASCKLRTNPIVRDQLNPGSIHALMIASFFVNAPLRYRLSLMLYILVASCTGLRSSSIVRSKNLSCSAPTTQTQKRTGAVWSDMHIWIRRSSTIQNDVVAFYKPRWSKTSLGRTQSFPILSGPNLGSSPNLFLLLVGDFEGVFEAPLKDILDPSFLNGWTGDRPLRIKKSR